MPVTITHSTPADGTFSATGAAAWDATHTVSGLGTMAEQNANNVNITGGSITGVTGVLSSLTVNSTPTSGGAAGQIMFDTGTVLQESSNLVWDNTNKKLTITGATVTTSQPVLDMTQTWNAAGVGFTGVKINITKTAANNGTSKYFDLQANSTSKFVVTPYGAQIINNADGFANFGVLASTTDTQICVGLGLTAVSGASNAAFSFGPGGSTAPDTFLTRRGAANLRFGAADAAAPVAQTLSVQSVVAGTSNTAGANLTITGSQGTGTGAGGSIIFQIAPAGTTGTAQNALTAFATIAPTGTGGSLTLTGGTLTASQPVLDMTQTWNNASTVFTAIRLNVTDTASSSFPILLSLQRNGSSIFTVSRTNDLGGGIFSSRIDAGEIQLSNWFFVGTTGPRMRSSGTLGWSSTGAASGTVDLFLSRRGAANLQLGAADSAAPVAQTLSVQSVVAGTSNTAGANLTITGSQGTGTGAGGSIIFQVAPDGASGTAQNALSTALTINPLNVNFGRVYVNAPVNTITASFISNGSDGSTSGAGMVGYQDSGGPVSNNGRLGYLFFGGTTAANSYVRSAGLAAFATQNWSGSAQGTRLAFYTVANSSTTRTERLGIENSGVVTFGGATSSFPALKPSSTILQVRLADDSAYAPVEASTVRTATAYTVATLPAAGTAGRKAYVTDATAPTFLGALIGGGAVVCPVFDNGTAWVAG